jgi:hypothetical protein
VSITLEDIGLSAFALSLSPRLSSTIRRGAGDRLEAALSFALALRSSGLGVHQAHAEARTRPQEPLGDVGGAVIDPVFPQFANLAAL